MRRFCYLGEQILLLFCRLGVGVHTFLWRPNGVTAACWIREPKGAGSIPAWGSNKTNEEVLELLLTWKSQSRDISSSQNRRGSSPVLF